MFPLLSLGHAGAHWWHTIHLTFECHMSQTAHWYIPPSKRGKSSLNLRRAYDIRKSISMLSPTFCWSHQPPHCAMSPVMAEDFCQDGRPGSSTAHNVAKPKLLSTNKDEVFTCLSEQSVFRIILLNIHIFSLSLKFQLGVLGRKASAQHCHPSFSTSGCSRY